MSEPGQEAPPDAVPLERVAKLVHLLAHDLRNDLNVIDLQASFTAQMSTEPATVEGLKKVRAMVAAANQHLRLITARFSPLQPSLIPLEAAIFVADFRAHVAEIFPAAAEQVRWEEEAGPAEIAVDLTLLRDALSEVFRNAFEVREPGAITVRIRAGEGRWTMELCEPKTAVPSTPDDWGRRPLVAIGREGYGLGLYQLRRVLAAHGGDVTFFHDAAAAVLTTRITLPLLPLLAA